MKKKTANRFAKILINTSRVSILLAFILFFVSMALDIPWLFGILTLLVLTSITSASISFNLAKQFDLDCFSSTAEKSDIDWWEDYFHSQ